MKCFTGEVKRVGAIVPVENDCKFNYEIIDDEFVCNWLNAHDLGNVEYVSSHIPEGIDVYASEFEYCEHLAAEDVLSTAAYDLRKRECNSVVWGCTIASFYRGVRYAERQVQLLSESAAVPASSTSMAFLAAVDVLKAQRVDVVSPYNTPEVAQMLISFFSEVGISVGSVWHMERSGSARIFDIDCEAELAKFVSSRPLSDDPILIPCTEISSLERLESFEKISGRPVLTANQVTLWHGLVLAGLTPNILDAGSFLRSYAQPGGPASRSFD
ncbi:hypothetical protein [Mesorhizobium sp. M0578]|uniref:maleate cis-trans isomerase family protein n=1 Tax=unclassified Mesorhizobium TaxID=325217 RepID=UPI00333D5314